MIGKFSAFRWFRRIAAVVILAGFMPLATAGCFGKFQLTRNIYSWNKAQSNDKWIRWLFFLLLTIIPIYGIGVWVDALILNSIEFWTGQNPVNASEAEKTIRMADGSSAVMRLQADDRIAVHLTAASGEEREFWLARSDDSIVAQNAAGVVLARVGEMNGTPYLMESSAVALR